MKIAVNKIKGLDKRVRQQMSPEKLEELSDSIKELGVIVPVKVRENGQGYTLIYGHRRVMAAKVAGLTEIEAIVEDVDDDALLTQSLAENVIREDMAAIDIAKALHTIIDETGVTNEALGKRLGWSEGNVRAYTAMLDEELGLTKSKSISIGALHVKQAKAGTGGDIKLAARVLEKAAKEELSTRDTRKVAEVVRQANEFGGAKAVARVFKQPTARVIEQAEEWVRPPRGKRRPPKAGATGPIRFQWIKDNQTTMAEDAIGAASTIVGLVAKGDRDPGGGLAWLQHFRVLVARLLDEVDQAIARLS